MLQDRDYEIVRFLDKFKVATTNTLYELFFKDVTLIYCRRRLKQLVEYKEIKRKRKHISDQYMYYLKFPKQLKHSLLLTEFYGEMHKRFDVVGFKVEESIGDLRSDGVIGYKYKGIDNKVIMAFIEVQTRNERVDIDKYRKLYYSQVWKKMFDSFPKIVAITSRKVDMCNEIEDIEVVKIREDLSDVGKLVKI